MKKEKAKSMIIKRKTAFVTLAVSLAALVTGCAAPRSDESLVTASIENDYRARHPISLAEAEHVLDVPIASGSMKLKVGARDTIKGFAQDYLNASSGVLQVSMPKGSVNAHTASKLKGQIKSVLVAAGVPAKRIAFSGYQAQSPEVSAPVHLSYVAITAVTSECGEWPEDLMNNSTANKNWHNFGCASQNNMAAMVANPSDLMRPRGMTSADAANRSNVISDYRGD